MHRDGGPAGRMKAENGTGGIIRDFSKTPVKNAEIGIIGIFRKTAVSALSRIPENAGEKLSAEMDRHYRDFPENAEIGIILPYIRGKIPPINRGFSPT